MNFLKTTYVATLDSSKIFVNSGERMSYFFLWKVLYLKNIFLEQISYPFFHTKKEPSVEEYLGGFLSVDITPKNNVIAQDIERVSIRNVLLNLI